MTDPGELPKLTYAALLVLQRQTRKTMNEAESLLSAIAYRLSVLEDEIIYQRNMQEKAFMEDDSP